MRGAKKFRKPKKFEFLVSILGRAEFATSFLVKAEVTREVVCNSSLSVDEIEILWRETSAALRWEYVDRFCFDESLIGLITYFKVRLRTLMNYQRLSIAVSKDCHFVTGDKGILDQARKKGNQKIMSYLELRRAFS
jgi:aminopeptidase-like protein